MGRRAVDLTTTVPVLGVPALVGVHGLKATGGDQGGGSLLKPTWGLQCSVGVQTSPLISRPPTQQLTDGPPAPSDRISPTTSGVITKKTEYTDMIVLLTRSDTEKKAILKHKSGESKTKKEVTFKEFHINASKDSPRNTSCDSKAIRSHPLEAGNVTSVSPHLKSAARYTNGSVVDSEVIGGISADLGGAEPIKGGTLHRKKQSTMQWHRAKQSSLASAAQPYVMPQKICSLCGGRRSVGAGVSTFWETNPTASGKTLSTLSTSMHLQMKHIERNRSIEEAQSSMTESRTCFTPNPQKAVNGEPSYCRTPHPACPVHSRGNRIAMARACATKTITITEATIETRESDPHSRSFAKPTQDSKFHQPAHLTLTPHVTTSIQPKHLAWHTFPKFHKTQKHNSKHSYMSQNVCVSFSSPGNTSKVSTHKTTVMLNTIQMSEKPTPVRVSSAQHEVTPLNMVHIATNTKETSTKHPDLLKTTSAIVESTPHGRPLFQLRTFAPHLHHSTAAAQTMGTNSENTARQINWIKTNDLKSEPTIQKSVDVEFQQPIFRLHSSSTPYDSKQILPLQKSLLTLKNVPSPTPCLSSSWTETPNTNGALPIESDSLNSQFVVCKTNPLTSSALLNMQTKHADSDVSINNPQSLVELRIQSNIDANKFSHERHDNSKPRQVTELRHISLRRSCRQVHMSTVQCYQECTKMEHNTTKEVDAVTGGIALSGTVSGTDIRLKSNTDASAKTSPTSFESSLPGPAGGDGGLSGHTGPESDSISLPLVSSPNPQFSEVEEMLRAASKQSSAHPQSCPADSGLALSHQGDTPLPPSPQCCKSAALQQQLETVEASLAANKDRIATLLNIIHDLESGHTPPVGWRCFKTGEDVKNCSTCQETACIVYSVEYDFRQQEKRFAEVLNHGNHGSLVRPSQPLNLSLLRNVIVRNFAKTKVKSNKLRKALSKWLPGRIQQMQTPEEDPCAV